MATAGEPQKRTRLGHDERRRQLLHAAGTLFMERPYSEVSITDIAEAAGVARGLVHHYFDSKRALYLEVVRAASQLSTRAVPSTDAAAGADDRRWLAALDSFLTFVEQNADLWVTTAMLGGPERDDELSTIVDESREVIAEQTIAALGLADVDSPTLRAVVRGYGGLVQEITLEWIERKRLTREQARTVLVRALPPLLEEVLPAIEPGDDVRP